MLPLLTFAIGAVIFAAALVVSISSLWKSSEACDLVSGSSRQSFEGEPWWERAVISRRMSIDAGICRVCGKSTTTQCSRCKSVKYCSIVCQRKDWGSNHKFECDNLQKLSALAASSGTDAAAAPSKPPPPDPNEDAPVPRQVLFPYQHYLQLCHNRNSCRKQPVGLTNLGNNCYANAALQVLLSNRPLRAYLDQGLHSSNCNKPSKHEWCLLCELQALCKRMAEAGPGDEVSVRPLLRHLRRFAKTLSYGRQEDAHEFFYSLLNTMEAIQLTNYGGKERFDMRSQETTLVHHVYGGYLRSQVVCGGCGAASRRYEVALDVTLEVLPGVDRLEDALAQHTAEEVLDGDNRYACDGCKQRCRATRSTRFEVAPNSLALSLKRFGTGRFGKINKMLSYGEHLDLRPYMAAGAMDEGEVTYTLSGVVVHLDQMNSTSFGHYICFVKTADGRWYGCDDARVAPTSTSRVLSQNAYMLFYQRDTHKPAPQPGYKRAKPLIPAAAVPAPAPAPAAAAPTAKQQQAAATAMANGAAAAAAVQENGVESDTERQQLDQQQPVQMQVPEQQLQQAMLQMAAEHLSRVSTAPAALVRMADELGSSSRDEEEVSVSSSSLAADVSECSTPSADTAQAAAAAAGSHHSFPGSSSTADDVQLAGDDGQQQQQQQDTATKTAQQQGACGDAGAGAAAAAADAADGNSSDSSIGLPQVAYQLKRIGPELMQLKAHLPGVSKASEVAVDVLNAGPQLQQLQLRVPGRFAPLDVLLSKLLAGDAGAAGAGCCQTVAAVSGKLYRRRHTLNLKLHLTVSQQQGGEPADGDNAQQQQQASSVVHWHCTDSGEASSSGSESDGFVMPLSSSFRSVMSEMDLSSFFGKQQQMMQELRSSGSSQGQQQQGDGAGAATAAAASGSSKQGKSGSKKGSKKGGKGKKRK